MGRFARSDVAALGSVLLKHARDAFRSNELIAEQWRGLHYVGPPDLELAAGEYDRFAALLDDLGVELHFAPADRRVGLDSIYVRDAAILCDRGAILCSMGKPARAAEPEVLGEALRQIGVPVIGRIGGHGRLEGGDVAWIDPQTLAVGRGYRTNDAGIAQLRELLADDVEELVVVPLPHGKGPDDVLHLMSIVSPVADDLAVVYSPWMPVVFRELLLRRGIRLVEVPDAEFATMGCNVLAVAPRRCVMLAGNPVTRRRLEQAGAEVIEFEGREISAKGSGGPTCLTRPLWRREIETTDKGRDGSDDGPTAT